MVGRIDPKTSAVYPDEYGNVRQGEFYVDEDFNIECKGLEDHDSANHDRH